MFSILSMWKELKKDMAISTQVKQKNRSYSSSINHEWCLHQSRICGNSSKCNLYMDGYYTVCVIFIMLQNLTFAYSTFFKLHFFVPVNMPVLHQLSSDFTLPSQCLTYLAKNGARNWIVCGVGLGFYWFTMIGSPTWLVTRSSIFS